jgi:peptidoglycan-associated lipoprotein
MIRLAPLACVALIALLAGCARQPGLAQGAAPAPTGAATTAGASNPASPKNAAGSGGAATARSTGTRGGPATAAGSERPAPAEFVGNANLQDIHFDFDRYELGDNDRQILDRHAAWMKEHPRTLMLVEGHCDERGTAEYNISLGERRAKATANYLTSRGVGSERITTISYGEQRPVCGDANETCWQNNRRAHFLVKQP